MSTTEAKKLTRGGPNPSLGRHYTVTRPALGFSRLIRLIELRRANPAARAFWEQEEIDALIYAALAYAVEYKAEIIEYDPELIIQLGEIAAAEGLHDTTENT